MFLFICILLHVGCSHRHVPDAFVSLHAFLPVFPIKLLYCDTANSPWIQTVWSNACKNKQKKHSSHKNTPLHFWQISMATCPNLFGQGKQKNQVWKMVQYVYCTRDSHVLRESYRIHQGWSEVCRNFEPHTSYRTCVSQRER